MNFEEMEALARAPQERVNLHIIDKLDSIESKVLDTAILVGEHETKLGTIEKRCAGRRWQGKLLWAALAASASLWVRSLWR